MINQIRIWFNLLSEKKFLNEFYMKIYLIWKLKKLNIKQMYDNSMDFKWNLFIKNIKSYLNINKYVK